MPAGGSGSVVSQVGGANAVVVVGVLQCSPVQPSSQMHVPSLPLQRPLPLHVVYILQCSVHSQEYMFPSHTWQPMPEKPSGHVATPVYALQLAPVQPSSQMHVPSLPLQRPLPLHVVSSLQCSVHPPE